MLTLFHYDRSTAAQRVRLTLEEKQIAWKSVVVDTARGDADNLPPDYYKYNPKGLVPAIVHNGRAVSESIIIQEYLDDAFPIPPLRPEDPHERARMRLWMRKIDDGIHVASRTIGVCLVNRHDYLAKSPEQLQKYYAKMRDAVRRNNDKINIEHGLASPLLPDALGQFRRLFEEMDHYLQSHAWLAGDSISLADLALVVYAERMGSFQMTPLWAHLTHFNEWVARLKARPSWKKAIVDWGDVTAAQREMHGAAVFADVRKLWDACAPYKPD